LYNSGITELDLSFPILPETTPGVMGFCRVFVKTWAKSGVKKKAVEQRVEWLGMRIRKENGPGFYDIQSLLATFIHELAHSITRTQLVFGIKLCIEVQFIS
jgi:hypothetical protein